MSAVIGACDVCSTEDVPVHRSANGQQTLCDVCGNLVWLREPTTQNLAVCTNMILRELRQISALLAAATQGGA